MSHFDTPNLAGSVDAGGLDFQRTRRAIPQLFHARHGYEPMSGLAFSPEPYEEPTIVSGRVKFRGQHHAMRILTEQNFVISLTSKRIQTPD